MKSLDQKLPRKEQKTEVGNFELARYYLNTTQGGDLVRYHDMTISDVDDFIKNPEAFADIFNLDNEDISAVHEWKEDILQQEEKNKTAYEELKEQYGRSHLFKDSFENIPDNFVSVFHSTSIDKIEGIGKTGLQPLKNVLAIKEASGVSKGSLEAFLEVEEIFDRYAPSGISRSNAVYASDDFHTGWFQDVVILEVKVDPEEVIIAEAGLRTEAAYRSNDSKRVADFASKYWETSIPLSEFRKLSIKDQLTRFNSPEVVIPHPVSEKYIRVFSVSK